MLNILSRFIKKTKGSVAIEFGLVVPVLYVLVTQVMNLGLILTKKNELNSIIAVGVLYAHKSSADLTALANHMKAATSMTSLTTTATSFCGCSDASVIACTDKCGDGTTPGTYVNVSASSKVSLFVPAVILANPFPFSATATVRVN